MIRKQAVVSRHPPSDMFSSCFVIKCHSFIRMFCDRMSQSHQERTAQTILSFMDKDDDRAYAFPCCWRTRTLTCSIFPPKALISHNAMGSSAGACTRATTKSAIGIVRRLIFVLFVGLSHCRPKCGASWRYNGYELSLTRIML